MLNPFPPQLFGLILIYQINSKLGVKKQRANENFFRLPSLAPEAGLEPATL